MKKLFLLLTLLALYGCAEDGKDDFGFKKPEGSKSCTNSGFKCE